MFYRNQNQNLLILERLKSIILNYLGMENKEKYYREENQNMLV